MNSIIRMLEKFNCLNIWTNPIDIKKDKISLSIHFDWMRAMSINISKNKQIQLVILFLIWNVLGCFGQASLEERLRALKKNNATFTNDLVFPIAIHY